MHLEESVVIPEALKVLNADDWRSIDRCTCYELRSTFHFKSP